MICLCKVSCSIGHLYHLLRSVYWVYLWSWVLMRFLWVFHSLSHSCYAFGVSRVHVRVLWDPMLLGSWLICIRYERWVIFLLGSPDHCLTHHSIIGDMTFLYYTNMCWSSFIPFSHYPYFISHYLFPDLCSTFYLFPTYWYTLLIRYLLHIIQMFH